MNLSFKLDSFEGPLDLLLQLIDKNKVDIYDIPISMITDQYLEVIRSMPEKDPDTMSEFLVMAATLLDIKAKMLLPKDEDEDGNEEDPRAELVQKLLEYKLYKYMSYELKDREVEASHSLYKKETIPDEVKKYEAPMDLDKMLEGTTLDRLQDIFNDVMARSLERTNLNALRMQSIQKEQVSIVDRVIYIREALTEKSEFSFRKLIEKQQTRINIIVTFLAVLEMMKGGEIRAEMTPDNNDIFIVRKEIGDENYEDIEIPEEIKLKEHRKEVRAINKAKREEEARLKAEQEAMIKVQSEDEAAIREMLDNVDAIETPEEETDLGAENERESNS